MWPFRLQKMLWGNDHIHKFIKMPDMLDRIQCSNVEEIECENEGCQHVFAREEMATHAASCQKKKIHCPDCSVGVTSDSFLAHQTSHCYHAVTQCPLNCGKTLPRWVFYAVVHKIFCALRGSFISSCSLQCWVTTYRGRRHSCLWYSLECYTRDLLCHNICVISPWWPLV